MLKKGKDILIVGEDGGAAEEEAISVKEDIGRVRWKERRSSARAWLK